MFLKNLVVCDCGARGEDGTGSGEPFGEAEWGGDCFGGGVYAVDSEIFLENVIVEGCSAEGGDGADGLDNQLWIEYSEWHICGDEGAAAGGKGGDACGGGIFIRRSNLTLTHCEIRGCSAVSGDGGDGGDSVVCPVCGYEGRGAEYGLPGCAFGGGICYEDSRIESMRNVLIAGCSVACGDYGADPDGQGAAYWQPIETSDGGAIAENYLVYHNTAQGEMINCTVADNSGGYDELANWGRIKNSIVLGQDDVSASAIEYSWIDAGDPRFGGLGTGAYHLKSAYGRWDSGSEAWVYDDVSSPCIDAGDPCSDWGGELWPHGRRINMGAYGGTAEASMSGSMVGHVADVNGDDFVDLCDFGLFAAEWPLAGVLRAEDFDRSG